MICQGCCERKLIGCATNLWVMLSPFVRGDGRGVDAISTIIYPS